METLLKYFVLMVLAINTFMPVVAQTSLVFSENPLLITGHKYTVSDLAFSPDGKQIYSGGGNNQVIVFDAETGKQLRNTPTTDKPVNDIALSSDGELFAYTGYNMESVRITNASTLEEVVSLNDFEVVYDICFVPGQHVLAVAGFTKSTRRQVIESYNAETGVKIRQYFTQDNVEKAFPATIDFSDDGKQLACGMSSVNQGVRIWETESGKLLRTISHNSDINVIDLSPDGKTVAGGCLDNNSYIWDAETGDLLHTLEGMSDFVMTINFSKDGLYLVTAGMDHTCTFKLWNTQTGELIQTVGGKGPDIEALCFSPDGRTLAVAYRTYGDLGNVATIRLFKAE